MKRVLFWGAIAAIGACQPMTVAGDANDVSAPDVVATDAHDTIDIAPPIDAMDVVDTTPPVDVTDADDADDATDATDATDGDAGAGITCPPLPPRPATNTGGICDAANVVDLDAAGAPGRTYIGWLNAPIRPDAEIMLGGCTVRGVVDSMNRQIVHSYTMHSTAYLRVSTDRLGTYCGPDGVTDTYVGMFRTCAAGAPGTNAYDCTDSNVWLTASPSTAFSGEAIPAGTQVFIVVGSISRNGHLESDGPYELAVEETAAPSGTDECYPEAESVTGASHQCPAGSACVASPEYNSVGHCVADGTAPLAFCRTVTPGDDGGATTECDPGLTCYAASSVDRRCYRDHAPGEHCQFDTDRCGGTNPFRCESNDPSNASDGVCFLYHTGVGAGCVEGPEMCPGGLVCSGPGLTGTCREVVAIGGTCDPAQRLAVCADGSSCASESDGFHCRADGTVAGSACRSAAPRCDGSLMCSVSAGPGRCEAQLPAGTTACDPRFGTNRCASPMVCVATGYATGTCMAPIDEPARDNNHPALAEVFASPAAVRGALPVAADVDCYAIDVAEGQSLRAEVNDGAAGCPQGEDPMITIHRPDGRVIDGGDDFYGTLCPQRDGAWTGSPLHALAAGRYAVCVHSWFGSAPIGRYIVNLSVSGP